jgi:hypothetical protein
MERLLLFLHIGFAIFTLGPLTAATMATPRYIRRGDVVVLRYLTRVTRIYGLGTLGILLVGLFLAEGRFNQVWLSASVTLFAVALVLLLIVERDQRKAAHLLEGAATEAAKASVAASSADRTERADKDAKDGKETKDDKRERKGNGGAAGEKEPAPARTAAVAQAADIAQVERGRIAAMSGVVALIWLVILVLMVWNG